LLVGVAAVAVIGSIEIGIARMTTTVPDGGVALENVPIADATPTDPLPTPAPTIDSLPPIDLSFVDLRTHRATPLPEAIRSLPEPANFQVSPDGGHVAFDSGLSIYISNLDGSELRSVAEGKTPWWSPDGDHLVFVSGGDELRLVDLTSGRVEPIFRADGAIIHPNFSPDGRTVLFTYMNPPGENGSRIWTVELEGGTAGPLSLPHGRAVFPAFGTYSPDGTTIVYRRTGYSGDITQMTSGGLWLADADGSDPRRLVDRLGWMSQIDLEALWPMWSPDGSRIAFQELYNTAAVVLDVGTGRLTRIGVGNDPTWVDSRTLIVENFDPNAASGR
jgi:Tol biopolymer transport system component